MAVEFRPATRADVPAIVGLLADDDIGRTREAGERAGDIAEAYWAAFDAIDADAQQLLVVAVDDAGEVVGTLQLSFIQYLTFAGGRRAQVEAVRIDRALRGSGVGSEMLRWAIDRAAERGCHLVQLTTDKDRAAAKRFYERLGFVASHEGMKLHLTPPA
jgi:ribosomal protein S18 acetylase RimI-like enzyme